MKDSKKDLSNVLHLINDETLEDVGSKRLYVSELAKKSYKLNPIRFQSDSIVNICRSYESLDLLNEKKLYAKYVESISKLNQLCIDGSPIIPLNQMRTDGNMTDYTLYLSHISSVVENYLTNKLNELTFQKDAKKNRWEILTEAVGEFHVNKPARINLFPQLIIEHNVSWIVGDSTYDVKENFLKLKGDFSRVTINATILNPITGEQNLIEG